MWWVVVPALNEAENLPVVIPQIVGNLTALATPALSVAGATAVALLVRVVHTLADLLLAVWCGGRRTPSSS